MRKLYTLAGAILFMTSASFAQAPAQDVPLATPKLAKDGDTHITYGKKANQNQTQVYGDVFWSEDFSGGFPGGWSVLDNLGNNYDWTWENQTTNFTANYTNVSPIASTTPGAGGYMMLFSDGYNANQPYVDMDSWFTTTLIDCSTRPSVICKFEEKMRYCCSSTTSMFYLSVSNDNTNWTNYNANYVINGLSGKVNVNTGSADPAVVYINISAIAAGQSTVYLRFHQTGASHYYWMLDDLELIEGPADDVVAMEEIVDFNYADADGFYTQTPTTQVGNDMEFRGVVLNNGANALTNSTMNVDIVDGLLNSVYNETSPVVANIGSLVLDTLFSIVNPLHWTNPATVEDYTALYTFAHAATDQDPLTDTISTKWSVTDSVYARDYGTPYSVIGPDNYVGGGVDGDRMGTFYEIFTDIDATSITAYIGPGTATTMSVYAQIWDLDATCNVTNKIAESVLTPITAGMVDDWYTFGIPTTLLSSTSPCGGTYAVLLEMYGYQGNDVFSFGEDDVVNQAPGWNIMWLAGDNAWYGFAAGVPMIRLNTLSALCGTFNASITVFSDESTNGAGDGSITVTATGGLAPYTYNWSSGGNAATEAGLSAGTYTCTITDANLCTEVLTQVLIISGIDEVALNAAVSIFPNPSNGVFTVEFTKAVGDDYNLEIRNLLGQEVYTEDLAISGNFTKHLDLKSLEKGVYFLHVSNSAGEATYKIVIE